MQFHESDAVETLNADGQGAVVILCEHASRFVPEWMDGLGLSEAELESHIAWDPGAEPVSLILSQALDAPIIAGRTSRLVYDCNRPPNANGAMPARSETTDVPGNANVSDAERHARITGVYDPYCHAVRKVLEARKALGLFTVLVTMHSFTPIYFGQPREVEIGILHDIDRRLADAMLSRADSLDRNIQRNVPYGPEDGVTHSLQIHGLAYGFPNVMIEIRNDLIRDAAGQSGLAKDVLTMLQPALSDLSGEVSDA